MKNQQHPSCISFGVKLLWFHRELLPSVLSGTKKCTKIFNFNNVLLKRFSVFFPDRWRKHQTFELFCYSTFATESILSLLSKKERKYCKLFFNKYFIKFQSGRAYNEFQKLQMYNTCRMIKKYTCFCYFYDFCELLSISWILFQALTVRGLMALKVKDVVPKIYICRIIRLRKRFSNWNCKWYEI